MWLLIMFDLPVDTETNRKAANRFRFTLLDYGFERCQYSVYMRFCEGKEQVDTWVAKIQSALPPGGCVYCMYLTDKQYERIVRFERSKRQAAFSNPEQFELF